MNALPSRVPGYTTNLTTPEVAAMPKLGWWSGMPRRQWRRMRKVVVVVVLKLGWWSGMPWRQWRRMPEVVAVF